MEELLKKPQTKKGRETLNNLLSAAAQLIYERGYYGANVGDITRLAGVATGTFYVYFDSKLSLYRFLLRHFSHQIRMELSKRTADCASRREAERVGLRAWLEYVQEHPYVYNIIWESLYVDRRLCDEYYEDFSRAYSRSLSAGKDAGEVAEIDNTVLSYALIGISSFIGLRYCLTNPGERDADWIADEVMKLLENGMFTGTVNQRIPHRVAPRRDAGFRVEVDYSLPDAND